MNEVPAHVTGCCVLRSRGTGVRCVLVEPTFGIREIVGVLAVMTGFVGVFLMWRWSGWQPALIMTITGTVVAGGVCHHVWERLRSRPRAPETSHRDAPSH